MIRFHSKGRPRHKPGVMNRLEEKYADYLEQLRIDGTVSKYWFEGIKLRLADRTFYTPDFFVLRGDGFLEVHECKGFMQDDANVKLKVAAETYPFRFFLVKAKAKREGGGWEIEEI